MDCSMPGLLSITNSRSLLKLRTIESVMPSNHLILCRPLHLGEFRFQVFNAELHLTSSVQSLSRVRLFATPWTAARQVSCPSPTPGACSNSWPLSQWCHPTISSFVVPFSSRLQSFPASGSFPVSQFFTSGGHSIGTSASVLPVNIQDWFPLGLTNSFRIPSGLMNSFSISFRIWLLIQALF